MRFIHDISSATMTTTSYAHSPIKLEVDAKPVYFIGPATRDNPLSQIRTKLFGNVYFNDPKIQWSRITLHFLGKAGLNIDAPNHSLPREIIQQHEFDLQESKLYSSSTTHLQTTITLCDVEKELIFTNEKVIDFGLHLPSFLPPSIKTKHAFVEYTLTVTCTAASTTANFMMSKKHRKTIVTKIRPVTIRRHYLPSPSSMIASTRFHGVREWFEWTAEVPKAAPVESGEAVIAFRWSVEKELVEVDRIESRLEELETYRFSTKSGIAHSLPAIVTQYPSSLYYPPTFSNGSETHFVRTPIHGKSIRTHHFDPFLEITHRLKLIVHFKAPHIRATPLELTFPMVITDFPTHSTLDSSVNRTSPLPSPISPSTLAISCSSSSTATDPIRNDHTTTIIQPGGDELSCVDLELPEYIPRYEDIIPTASSSASVNRC